MPPEEPASLVAVKLDFADGKLLCHAERAIPANEFLRVSWYAAPNPIPPDYQPILGGVVFAYKPSVGASSPLPDLNPTKRGDRYVWRDVAGSNGLMYVMVLPIGYTIVNPNPPPVEAKEFEKRLALFWLIFPNKGHAASSVSVEWSLSQLREELPLEIDTINRQIFFASKRERTIDYDIALSFAGEDRA